VKAIKKYAKEKGVDAVKISAKVEEEMIGLSDEERNEFLDSYGVNESGLEKIIRTGFHTLGLISYFTAGPKEVRAWTIHNGWKAPQAAGVIHTDFEKGFIRAEVISYNDYIKFGSETACKSAGVMRIEGKDYIVQDGDIMHFLFNV
jgi:ribosome-binding ATPase YchF (GTP1/OBG family)